MCEIYWETANTSPSVPPTFCGEQRSVPNFEKRECQEESEYLGGLKAWGLIVFLIKEDWKIKYGFICWSLPVSAAKQPINA